MFSLSPLSISCMEKSLCNNSEFLTQQSGEQTYEHHVEREDVTIHKRGTWWVFVSRFDVCECTNQSERERVLLTEEFMSGHRSWPWALHAYSAGHTHYDPPPARLQTTHPPSQTQTVRLTFTQDPSLYLHWQRENEEITEIWKQVRQTHHTERHSWHVELHNKQCDTR